MVFVCYGVGVQEEEGTPIIVGGTPKQCLPSFSRAYWPLGIGIFSLLSSGRNSRQSWERNYSGQTTSSPPSAGPMGVALQGALLSGILGT